MLEYLLRKIEVLLDSLVEPIWQRIVRMPWVVRLGVLIGLVAAFLAARDPKAVLAFAPRLRAIVCVALSTNERLPIRETPARIARETAARIEDTLLPELVRAGDFGREAWPMAQTVVAARSIASIDSTAILAFFDSAADASCGCWRQIPGVSHPRNIVVTGWVCVAKARLSDSASEQTVRFLLKEQDPDGWWSVFPVNGQQTFASVYGTAWAVLGLRAYLESGSIPASQKTRVEQAIQRASAWILSKRQRGQARWATYPNAAEPRASLAASGLALHLLHRLGSEDVAAIDVLWLSDLPSLPPSVYQSETAAAWIDGTEGRFEDTLAQLTLPWAIIGTVDAYSNGSISQRANAVSWLEAALLDPSMRDADTQLPNWWRAELLVSLNYLLPHLQNEGRGEPEDPIR
jgi:hypothetical protein